MSNRRNSKKQPVRRSKRTRNPTKPYSPSIDVSVESPEAPSYSEDSEGGDTVIQIFDQSPKSPDSTEHNQESKLPEPASQKVLEQEPERDLEQERNKQQEQEQEDQKEQEQQQEEQEVKPQVRFNVLVSGPLGGFRTGLGSQLFPLGKFEQEQVTAENIRHNLVSRYPQFAGLPLRVVTNARKQDTFEDDSLAAEFQKRVKKNEPIFS